MSKEINELTVKWEEDGLLKSKEIKKHILTKGLWSTLIFLYQDLDMKTNLYKDPKISIRRYKKYNGDYILQSKFNISSKSQGLDIARLINDWYK